MIHRDIKPENVLFHDGRALVADFGIALAATKAAGERMTQTGMSLGTPLYMSPEQALGEREITARSDVYSLGAVTYEMLVGEPPFTGANAQAIVAKVLTTEPEPPSSARKSIPPHVEDAILAALEKLPADRFATAAAFAESLVGERFHDGSGAIASSAGSFGLGGWDRKATFDRGGCSARDVVLAAAPVDGAARSSAATPLRRPLAWRSRSAYPAWIDRRSRSRPTGAASCRSCPTATVSTGSWCATLARCRSPRSRAAKAPWIRCSRSMASGSASTPTGSCGRFRRAEGPRWISRLRGGRGAGNLADPYLHPRGPPVERSAPGGISNS